MTDNFCFIPARSGSTRVKNKNIQLVKGRPLFYWTVKSAIKSKCFKKIIFSSDSERYFSILKYYLKKDRLNQKNILFDLRDTIHAKKKSKIFDYLKFDLIQKFNIPKNNLLVQLLPTFPFRRVKTIQKAIQISHKQKTNLFSASIYDFHVSFAFELKNKSKKWKSIFKNSPMNDGNTQSQSQKIFYHPNGVINCLWVNDNLKNFNSIYSKAVPFITSKIESFDIDTYEDLEIIKILSNKVLKL